MTFGIVVVVYWGGKRPFLGIGAGVLGTTAGWGMTGAGGVRGAELLIVNGGNGLETGEGERRGRRPAAAK